MSRIKCYSVRLKNLTDYSPKAYKATDWQGNICYIPKSHYFGQDWDVMKSEAHWIAAWIIDQSNLVASKKKEAWFDNESGKQLPTIIVTKHVPERKQPLLNNTIKKLKK